jgi:hypothetical protein
LLLPTAFVSDNASDVFLSAAHRLLSFEKLNFECETILHRKRLTQNNYFDEIKISTAFSVFYQLKYWHPTYYVFQLWKMVIKYLLSAVAARLILFAGRSVTIDEVKSINILHIYIYTFGFFTAFLFILQIPRWQGCCCWIKKWSQVNHFYWSLVLWIYILLN